MRVFIPSTDQSGCRPLAFVLKVDYHGVCNEPIPAEVTVVSLVRLLYVSRLSKRCGPDEMRAIQQVSRENNLTSGVTGALCYSARGFLQCLEGPAAAVNEIYRRIARDDRNENVTLLDYTGIEQRDFGQWSMAFIRDDEIDSRILAKIRGASTFDPFDLAPGEAMDFLKDVTLERAEFLARQQAAVEKKRGST